MKKFGICMDGCEVQLEHLLINEVNARKKGINPSFCYIEIGVASGETLLAITEIVSAAAGQMAWWAVGIDIEKGWSLDKGKIVHRLTEHHLQWLKPSDPPVALSVTMYLHPGADLMNNLWTGPKVDFALIDGCHGRACVTADFNAVAKHCYSGSVVVFHDAAKADENSQIQPHCKEGIRVFTAISELGLLDGKCHGWAFVCWIHGDKSKNGNSCAVVRKL